MNWLDLLLILFILMSCWQGLRYGLLSGLAGLVGLAGGLWLAYRTYTVAGGYLSTWWPALGRGLLSLPVPQWSIKAAKGGLAPALLNLTVADVVAFAVVFLVAERLAVALGRAGRGLVAAVGLGPLDRLGGFALGLARGAALVMILAFLLAPLRQGILPWNVLPGLAFLTQSLAASRLLGAAWHLLAALGLYPLSGWPVPWRSI